MATAARLPIAADRVGACVRTLYFVGLNLTGVDLRLQARIAPDTPGAPRIDLTTQTDPDAEGLMFVGVTFDDGLPTSEIRLRIAEATMQDGTKIPYSALVGEAATLSYDLIGVFDYDKRRLVYGDLIALPTTYGADDAPSNRPNGGASSAGFSTWSTAQLTFSDDVASVTIDGIDLVAGLLSRSEAANASAIAIVGQLAELKEAFSSYVMPDYTVESGYFNADTGAAINAEGWNRIRLPGAPGDEVRITSLVRSSLTSLASFYDADGVRVGDIILPGTDTGIQYVQIPVTYPPQAVMLKSSSSIFDAQFRIERLDVDAELVTDVAELPDAAAGWTEQVVPAIPGFYNSIGAYSSSDGWHTALLPITGGRWARARGGTRKGAASAVMMFLRIVGGVTTVLASHEPGDDYETPFAFTSYQAPPRTTHVAVTTYGSWAMRIWLTQPLADLGRQLVDLRDLANPLRGQTALWIGTSIPAGGGIGGDYPSMVGDVTGMTVINVAVPGSSAREGVASLRSADDVYGWTGVYWGNVFVLMGKTLEACDDLINNWESKWRARVGSPAGDPAPTTLTDAMKAQIRATSFENILVPYINSATPPDRFVFDHGLNCWGIAFNSPVAAPAFAQDMTVVPATRFDRGTFIGAHEFYFDLIWQKLPRAKIMLIGHYQNDFKANVSEGQILLRQRTSYPLFKTWEKLGWSQQIISAGPNAGKKVIEMWLTDRTHPHSDLTGGANRHITTKLAPWMAANA